MKQNTIEINTRICAFLGIDMHQLKRVELVLEPDGARVTTTRYVRGPIGNPTLSEQTQEFVLVPREEIGQPRGLGPLTPDEVRAAEDAAASQRQHGHGDV